MEGLAESSACQLHGRMNMGSQESSCYARPDTLSEAVASMVATSLLIDYLLSTVYIRIKAGY